MANPKAKSKTPRKKKAAATRRTRGKLAPGANARGLDASQVAIALDSPDIAEVDVDWQFLLPVDPQRLIRFAAGLKDVSGKPTSAGDSQLTPVALP